MNIIIGEELTVFELVNKHYLDTIGYVEVFQPVLFVVNIITADRKKKKTHCF